MERTATLLERERELQTIEDALDAAVEGAGTLLVIRGGAGIGKTRLLEAACRLARGRGIGVLSARGGELERELPFGIVGQLFEPFLARAGDEERERLLAGPAALAAPIVTGSPADPVRTTPTFATLHGLHWLTVHVADGGPHLIAVDDVHWADAASLRFLAYLARRLDGLPLLVALTVRNGGDAGGELVRALAGDPRALAVVPAPLGEGAVAAIVAEELGAAPDARFAGACHAATGGNPFLVRELAVALRDRGVTPVAAEAERVPRLAPEQVANAVEARLAALPGGAGDLARAVAVLGDDADLGAAARLARLDADEAAVLADALAAAEVLEPRTPLRFVHPIVRAAVVGLLGPGTRSDWHRRAARLLAETGATSERVAMHLIAASPVGEPWASEALCAAGRRAAARGAPEAAAVYLRRALDEPAPDGRPGLLLELGLARLRAGRPSALRTLERAHAAARGPLERATAALALGGAHFGFGQLEASVAVHRSALSELGDAERTDAGRELVLEHEAGLLGAARQHLATRPLAVERLRRLDPDLEPSSLAACKVLANLANEEMARLGSRERAVMLAKRSLEHGRLIDDEPMVTFPLAASTLTIAGELELATHVFDQAIARTRSRGAAVDMALAGTFRALNMLACGQPVEAAADARSALEIAEEQAPLATPYAASFLAGALTEIGDLDEAARVLEGVAAAAAVPQAFAGVWVLWARGRLLHARGRLDQAAADLHECERRLRAWQVSNPGLAGSCGELALVERARGHADEARRLAAADLDRARRWGAGWTLAAALRASGVVEDGERGLAQLREAAAVAARGGAALERAKALVEVGSALLRAGSHGEAREPLREALELAERAGAAALARRAHDQLVLSGARPRRPNATGREALTPAERRVAGMAAEGMTNREIAQALFVSEKTVETHLRNVFRKLALASRSQLPAAL